MIRSPAGYDGDIRIKRYQDYYQASYGAMMLSAGQVAFSPIDLFASGAPGVWYDSSDLTTMFQDAAGTTPVSAVEQPVGLRLDKSRGLIVGTTEFVTNGGPFTATTGWASTASASLAVSSGSLTVAGNGVTAFPNAYFGFDTVVGRTYKVMMTLGAASAAVTVVAKSTKNYGAGTTITSASVSSSGGAITFYFTATTTGSSVGFESASASWTGSVSLVSVRELPGSHAFQTIDINRPVLSARYNLLTQTEEFDNAAWTKSRASVTANAAAAPDGTQTADKLVEDTTASSTHRVFEGTTYTATTHTWSVACKAAERTWVYLRLLNPSAANIGAYFNLATGAVGTVSSGVTASMTSLGNGWYRCSIMGATASVPTSYIGLATGDNGEAYTGDGTSGIYIWGADLRVSNDGVGLPAYQRVTTATDYDTTGFPLYLRYNGTNSTMQTAAINFTSTDKMSVFAGVRKLSDAANGVLAELSADRGLNSGAFTFLSPGGAVIGSDKYAFVSKGTLDSAANTTNTAYNAPTTNIVTGFNDISGDSTILRANATQVGSNTTNQGTGNYGNYPLYLGARGGSSLWFNGRDYGLCVLGRTATAAEIANMESWLNAKVKAYA